MSLFEIVFQVIGSFIIGGLMLLLALFPRRIVQAQGRFYRAVYRDQTPEEIDRAARSPLDTFISGTRSEFIRLAPEHPESFPRLVLAFRVFGGAVAAIMFLVGTAQLLILLLT